MVPPDADRKITVLLADDHPLVQAALSASLQPAFPGAQFRGAGTIDGLVWSGGLPTPEITDLVTSMGDQVRFVDITGLLPKMREINPVYEEGSLPADTYRLPEDVPTIVVPNMLLVRTDFTDDDACAITKLIFDRKADLAKVHKAANALDRATAVETDPVPLHPGAEQALSTG